MERTTASAVPQTAICSVTAISVRYSCHWLKSGGKKSAANVAMLPPSLISVSGAISAPCHETTNTASTTAQLRSENQLRLGGAMVMVCMFGSGL